MSNIIFVFSFILLLAMFPTATFCQDSPGSIGASWDKASKPKVSEKRQPVPRQQSARRVGEASGSWDSKRTMESSPWPFLPKSPTPSQYHAANGMVIDSLHQLYCLSAGYVRSLRMRNDGALRAGPQDQRKDFQYNAPSIKDQRTDNQSRESLASLHRELLQLLHNCLYGR